MVAFVVLLVSSHVARAASPGHIECERAFKRLSKGRVVAVPEVKDWGDAREYYFAWNAGSQSQLIRTNQGSASGSCTIDKRTGEGFVTLNAKDLGAFKASLGK
jgi:hypothetical protein